MPGQVIEVHPPRTLTAGRGRGPGGHAGWPYAPAGCCPVPGCDEEIDVSRLMCRHDWYAVPKPLRDRVWATWRSGRGALRAEHQEAVRRAILALARRHEARAG